MIKIRIREFEFTLNGSVWSGEDQVLVDILNSETEDRPFRYEPRVESSVAAYIVSKNKEYGAEIIYDSEAGKPKRPPHSDRRKY